VLSSMLHIRMGSTSRFGLARNRRTRDIVDRGHDGGRNSGRRDWRCDEARWAGHGVTRGLPGRCRRDGWDWHRGPHQQGPWPSSRTRRPASYLHAVAHLSGWSGRKAVTVLVLPLMRRIGHGGVAPVSTHSAARATAVEYAALAPPALKMTKLAKGELCPERAPATEARASTGRGSPRPWLASLWTLT
jgi:hypothetical protein